VAELGGHGDHRIHPHEINKVPLRHRLFEMGSLERISGITIL
jgi:hypothetical protein